ncbi:hypothetical protein C8R48DRAFT_761276 [Suillus tomentosus]|nr:hypothetical protein C8R48DRAFT_761276 [Suillus tomentosus]
MGVPVSKMGNDDVRIVALPQAVAIRDIAIQHGGEDALVPKSHCWRQTNTSPHDDGHDYDLGDGPTNINYIGLLLNIIRLSAQAPVAVEKQERWETRVLNASITSNLDLNHRSAVLFCHVRVAPLNVCCRASYSQFRPQPLHAVTSIGVFASTLLVERIPGSTSPYITF